MEKSIILFDGPCTLCNKSVAWIERRDSKNQFLFGSLQGNWAKTHVPHHLLNEDTVLLFSRGQFYTRSTAALIILSSLPYWHWTILFKAVPRFVRDGVYRSIAKNREHWFGTGYCALLPDDKIVK